MADFLAATAVEPRGDASGFDVELDQQWSGSTRLHGGYLLAVLGRAAGRTATAAHPHLTSITGAFLASPEPGAAQVSVEVLRVGRSVTHLRARLTQNGAPCVEALISQGRLTEADPWWSGLEPVKLPAEADCVLVPRNALGVPGWAPTVSLTAYVRRLPAPGPLRVRLTVSEMAGDRMDEVAYAWDADGRLVAQATQIAAIRLPT